MEIHETLRRAAADVPGVLGVEQLLVRRAGMQYRVTIHVHAEPSMRLDEAHVLSGRVKGAITGAVPRVPSVLVHMEPWLQQPEK